MTKENAPRVIFVCTGNTCRSPLAEFYWRYLEEKIAENKESLTTSRGVRVRDEFSVVPDQSYFAVEEWCKKDKKSAEKRELLLKWMKAHRAESLADKDLDEKVLVVCMTNAHKKLFEEQFPKANSVRVLRSDGGDVVDPFQKENAVYDECFEVIRSECDKLWKELHDF